MKNLFACVLLLLSTITLLSGCWNQQELTDLAFVMAMGVDKGKKEKFDVSYQVVVPASVASGQNGGGAQGSPVVVYKSSGNNLTEASRRATKQIPRSIYYAHTMILVISEELARDGILDLLDALDRDAVFRTTTFVTIAKGGRAEDFIATLTNLDKIPVQKFTKTLQATERMLGENIKVSIDDILANLIDPGKEPVISGFRLTGNPKKGTTPQSVVTTKPPAVVTPDGLAVFKGGKLAGWLTGNEAKGAVWVMKKMQGTDINFNWEGKKDAVSTIPFISKTKISLVRKNGKPSMNVLIETSFKLSEINVPYEVTNSMSMDVIEKKTAEQIKKDVERSIHKAQSLKADIFGFGDYLHRANPKIWKKMKGDWNDQFAKMEIHVKVDAHYRSAGKRNNPFWNDLKQ